MDVHAMVASYYKGTPADHFQSPKSKHSTHPASHQKRQFFSSCQSPQPAAVAKLCSQIEHEPKNQRNYFDCQYEHNVPGTQPWLSEVVAAPYLATKRTQREAFTHESSTHTTHKMYESSVYDTIQQDVQCTTYLRVSVIQCEFWFSSVRASRAFGAGTSQFSICFSFGRFVHIPGLGLVTSENSFSEPLLLLEVRLYLLSLLFKRE